MKDEGRIRRMNIHRWPQQILEWSPPYHEIKLDREKGMEGTEKVLQAMENKNLNEDDGMHRRRWKPGREKRRQP